MTKCVLFIDGENFLHKIREVLKESGLDKNKYNLAHINFNSLLNLPLKGYKIDRKLFYASRLHSNPDTKEKSQELISFQRALRNHLIKQGFEFIIAGNVRSSVIDRKIVFREKGVDVKIAVDMVALGYKKQLGCAILASSDSDLQPAIAELHEQKVKTVYLGFETNPNKGLSYTTNRTILLRNPEVLSACPKK